MDDVQCTSTCGWRKMENMRRKPTRASMASRILSTFESAGLAATATFAGALWVGLALPGLPLLPGIGGGQNSNVAISLNSAVLGVQDSRTYAASSGVSGRQARLLSLLLPTPDPLGKKLATQTPDAGAQRVVCKDRFLQPWNGAEHDPHWRRCGHDVRRPYPCSALSVKQNLVTQLERFADHFCARGFGYQTIIKRIAKPRD